MRIYFNCEKHYAEFKVVGTILPLILFQFLELFCHQIFQAEMILMLKVVMSIIFWDPVQVNNESFRSK